MSGKAVASPRGEKAQEPKEPATSTFETEAALAETIARIATTLTQKERGKEKEKARREIRTKEKTVIKEKGKEIKVQRETNLPLPHLEENHRQERTTEHLVKTGRTVHAQKETTVTFGMPHRVNSTNKVLAVMVTSVLGNMWVKRHPPVLPETASQALKLGLSKVQTLRLNAAKPKGKAEPKAKAGAGLVMAMTALMVCGSKGNPIFGPNALPTYTIAPNHTVQFHHSLQKKFEKDMLTPSLNILQPRLNQKAVDYYAGNRAKVGDDNTMFTNMAQHAAWKLNKEIIPRKAKYHEELCTFFHEGKAEKVIVSIKATAPSRFHRRQRCLLSFGL